MSISPATSVEGADWDTFLRRTALYIDASRLAVCFGGQLGHDLCARLKTSTRLEQRLTDRVTSHYALALGATPEVASEADRAVALASASELIDLARHCGAIYWADNIATAILAPQVKAIHAALGETLARYALAHRDLSGPAQRLEPLDTLNARAMDDGWRCLSAWCNAQADGIGARVRLKLPPCAALDDPPESPFAELGAAIVRRAAAR